MIDFIQEQLLDVSDRALHELIVSGNALRIKNDEEAYGHLVRHLSAVRSMSKEVDRAMEKAASAMISGENFGDKVNEAYISAQGLSAAAARMSLCARQIYEQNTIWPFARVGMTPMEAMAGEVEDGRRETKAVQNL